MGQGVEERERGSKRTVVVGIGVVATELVVEVLTTDALISATSITVASLQLGSFQREKRGRRR